MLYTVFSVFDHIKEITTRNQKLQLSRYARAFLLLFFSLSTSIYLISKGRKPQDLWVIRIPCSHCCSNLFIIMWFMLHIFLCAFSKHNLEFQSRHSIVQFENFMPWNDNNKFQKKVLNSFVLCITKWSTLTLCFIFFNNFSFIFFSFIFRIKLLDNFIF